MYARVHILYAIGFLVLLQELEGDGAGAVCFCGDVNFGDIFW